MWKIIVYWVIISLVVGWLMSLFFRGMDKDLDGY